MAKLNRAGHAGKIKAVESAIEDLFSDTTFGQQETLDDLREIRTDLDFKIGCIRRDLERQGIER